MIASKSHRRLWLDLAAVLSVLGVAGFWRFYHLDYRSLWYDEVQVVKVANLPSLSDVIIGTKSHVSAPPIDYILRHFWQNLGGVSDSWLRAYSGIWGLLAVLLAYLVGRRMFGEGAGLLGALFMAVARFQVHYSAEVKFYAPLVAMYLLVVYSWLAALRHRTLLGWFGFGMACLLGVYVHPYVVFGIVYCLAASFAHWILGWVKGMKSLRAEAQFPQCLVAAVIVGLLYLPLVLWHFVGQEKGWAPPELTPDFVYNVLAAFLLPGLLGLAISLVGIAVAAWASFRVWRYEVLPAWLTVIVSIIPVFVLDIGGRYPLIDKQLIFVQPFLLMLVASGLTLLVNSVIAKWPRSAKIPSGTWGLAVVAVLVVAGSTPGLLEEKDPANWQSNNWRSVISAIASQVRPGDMILWSARQGSSDSTYSSVVHWYLERDGLDHIAVELVQWWEHKTVDLAYLRSLADSGRFHGVWLFGQEVDTVFEDAGISDEFQKTVVGNVKLYYIPDLNTWSTRFLSASVPFSIGMGAPFKQRVFMAASYVYPLSLTIQNSTICTVQTALDGVVQSKTGISASSESHEITAVIRPTATGEHLLGVSLEGCSSIEVQKGSLAWVKKVDYGQAPSRIESREMQLVGDSQYDTDAALRSFIWEYKAADTAEFSFWTSQPGHYRLSLTAAASGPPPARLSIQVDKIAVGTMEFPEEWATSTLTVVIPSAGLHEGTLAFKNDYSGPDGDRNAKIEAVKLEALDQSVPAMEALDLSALAANYHGGTVLNKGVLEMWWAGAGAATFKAPPGRYNFLVQAWGQQGCGIWPLLRLSVDGREIETRKIDSEDLQALEFPNVVLTGGDRHSIGIEFVQPGDCDQPGQDVNLFVQGIQYERTE